MFNKCSLLSPALIMAVAQCFEAGLVNAEGTQAKPNIILFISDDHGWADSGAYGDDYIQTPNIDRLAKQGMRFDSAFAAGPLCSPSRCVIQTGLMPHRNGGHKFGTPINAGINLADLLPTCIEAAGGSAPKNLDGRSIVPILFGRREEHRNRVFGTHTGNDNGGPGTANHCPARTVRDRRFRYIFNLDPETTFTTHITGQQTGPHYLPHWDSWVEKAKLDEKAKSIVHAYQHRPVEELYDLEKDPYEMENLAARPEYGPILKDMRQELSRWRRSQNDFEQNYQ